MARAGGRTRQNAGHRRGSRQYALEPVQFDRLGRHIRARPSAPERGHATSLFAAVVGGSLLATALLGCNSSSASACGPARRQQAQPDNIVHVVAGGIDPTYLTDPPTSGPHLPMPTNRLVFTEPLPRAAQVGILEGGGVLVQYRPGDTGATERSELEALAGDSLYVAPNPDLKSPVVASAWVHLMECNAVDRTALRAFADEHANRGPGSH